MTQAQLSTESVIAEAEELYPGVVHISLWQRLRAYLPFLLGVSVFIWVCLDTDLSPATFMRGIDKLGDFLGRMVPPSDGNAPLRILEALAETFAMALVGTLFAAILAVPLGLIGAKNIVSFGPVHFIVRRIFDFFRGIPALVWALVLVSAFGLGPFGGVIALALADTPVLSKLYAEAIENIDPKPSEGLISTGASKFDALRYAVTPQVAPVVLSQVLFYLESNFRNAAVLGIVGAGGIGFELDERIRIFAFDQVAFIIILYMISVAILDTISGKLRAKLANT